MGTALANSLITSPRCFPFPRPPPPLSRAYPDSCIIIMRNAFLARNVRFPNTNISFICHLDLRILFLFYFHVPIIRVGQTAIAFFM